MNKYKKELPIVKFYRSIGPAIFAGCRYTFLMGVLKDLDLKSIANSRSSHYRHNGFQHAWLCLANSANKAQRVYDFSAGSTDHHAELWLLEPGRLAALIVSFTTSYGLAPDSLYIYTYFSPCDTCAWRLSQVAFAHRAICFTKLWIDTQTGSGFGYPSAARAMQPLTALGNAGYIIKQFPNPWNETNALSNWHYPSSLV